MSAPTAPIQRRPGTIRGAWRQRLQDQPIIPLLGLLVVLLIVLQVVQPGILSISWVGTTIKFAVPLAILAASQTLVMLTGGIDLSVASIATMTAYLAATQSSSQGDATAIAIGLVAAAIVGLVNGVGVGIFRVQPLIMTLGMGLVVAGLLTIYQVIAIATAAAVPAPVVWLGAGTSFDVFPNTLLLFVPLAAITLVGLRRSGFGRLLYAIGDNATASRLAGVRVWRVQVTVYVIAGLLAGIAGLMISAITGTASLGLADSYLLPSVAAVVIGGTSIFGGRGGYTGSIVGALILTILVSLMTLLDAPNAVRQMLYGTIILVVAAAYVRVTQQT